MKLAIQQTVISGSRHLFLSFVLAAITAPVASALQIRGELVTQNDIAVLPPVCKLIVVEKPGVHHGGGDRPLQEYAALFQQPGYEMAAHNPHLHHYCWALISKQRYFRANGKTQRDFYYKQFIGDIDYVLNNTADKSWPFFHVLLVEQAGMMNIRGEYPNSLLKIDQALKSKPDYDKAHALRSDVFLGMGDKKKAIEAAQVGLEKDPRSRLLRRRLEQLGVKVPPPPDPVAGHSRENTSSAETAAGAASTPEAGKGVDNGGSIAAPAAEMPKARESGPDVEAKPNMAPAADSAGKDQAPPATGTGSQPGKPYCRFCP